jgi:phage baseplate assembly protein W
MANNTFIDIDFAFSANKFTSDLNLVQDNIAIKQSIRNIISTETREKSFKPRFGSGLSGLLFEQDDIILYTTLATIKDQIQSYEPRVTISKITPIRTNSNLSISIEYSYILDGKKKIDKTKIDVNSGSSPSSGSGY